jgi:hypothetical protein
MGRKRFVTADRLEHVKWIGGSSCGGKSTVREMLSEEFDVIPYHGDAEVLRHAKNSTRKKCPTLWLALRYYYRKMFWGWLFDQSPSDMSQFLKDAGREDFCHVVSDLLTMPRKRKIVVDIFATHPEAVASVAAPENVVLLVPKDSFQREIIIENAKRRGKEPRENYIEAQHLFSKWIRQETKRLNMTVIETGGHIDIGDMYERVCLSLRLVNDDDSK